VDVDHVLLAVDDLERAAAEIEARFGLTAVEGGRHPGWGTANRIVPLGDTYLELVAVVDAAEASGSAFGRWVATGASSSLRPLGWAVRVTGIDEHAGRLGLDVVDGMRALTDGSMLRWRTAGMEQAADRPLLPFFIEWEPSSLYPGRGSGLPAGTVSYLELDGDPDELARWLGDHELPVVVQTGLPAVRRVGIATAAGTIAIGGAD
jgi:glyoxalase-like protein